MGGTKSTPSGQGQKVPMGGRSERVQLSPQAGSVLSGEGPLWGWNYHSSGCSWMGLAFQRRFSGPAVWPSG